MPIVKIYNTKKLNINTEKLFGILENGFGVPREKVKIISILADEIQPKGIFIEIQAIARPERPPPYFKKGFTKI